MEARSINDGHPPTTAEWNSGNENRQARCGVHLSRRERQEAFPIRCHG